jgi:hypothetical protein
VQAGVYLSRPWPFEVMAMAMLLEHHKRLEQLLAQLEALCRHTYPPTAPALDTSHAAPPLTHTLTAPLLPLEEGWNGGDTPAST